MKLIILLLLSSLSALAADDIDEKTYKIGQLQCDEIKAKAGDFMEGSPVLSELAETISNDGELRGYFYTAANYVEKTLGDFCDKKRGQVTISELRDFHYKVCIQSCNNKPVSAGNESLVISSEKAKFFKANCPTLCEVKYMELSGMKTGLRMAFEKVRFDKTKTSSNDCAGTVSTADRSKSKSVELEKVTQEVVKTLQK